MRGAPIAARPPRDDSPDRPQDLRRARANRPTFAPAGSRLHAVAETGIPTRDIAEAIGAGLGLPVTSIDPTDAEDHFGFIGRFFAMEMSATSDATRELLGWEPTGVRLLEDIAGGAYFPVRGG